MEPVFVHGIPKISLQSTNESVRGQAAGVHSIILAVVILLLNLILN
jgi:hypothetical protein